MPDSKSYARKPAGFIAALVTLVVMALVPAAARAGAVASAGTTFPTTVTVGQTGVAASLTLENRNTSPNVNDVNSVCNAGELSPPCASPENGIVLTPACKQIASGQCTAAGADPGVFAVSATGSGRIGTNCTGMTFNTSIIDPVFGTVRFTPQPAGAHVTLPGFGAQCVIDFTFNVVKSPTGDQDPATAGTQTAQATEHTQFVGTFGPGALNNFARGTSNGTTVLRAGPPAIATVASPDITLGGALTDQATVTGLVNPPAGGVVTFNLYPPAATTCTGPPVFTSVKVVTVSGTPATTATATSDAFTPTTGGVYRWVATYGGDANNLGITGACGIATETRTVTVPCTPPPGTPPPGGTVCKPPPPPPPGQKVCTTPPGPAPAGGVLCARGTAAVRGRTGCQGSPFNVVVSGRQISRVVFAVDGKVVRTLTKPNSGSRYTLPLNPRKLRIGVHRVIARTIFRSQSGTKPRVLRVTFSKCARRAVSPAFTG
jgi:hypothetical protein